MRRSSRHNSSASSFFHFLLFDFYVPYLSCVWFSDANAKHDTMSVLFFSCSPVLLGVFSCFGGCMTRFYVLFFTTSSMGSAYLCMHFLARMGEVVVFVRDTMETGGGPRRKGGGFFDF